MARLNFRLGSYVKKRKIKQIISFFADLRRILYEDPACANTFVWHCISFRYTYVYFEMDSYS